MTGVLKLKIQNHKIKIFEITRITCIFKYFQIENIYLKWYKYFKNVTVFDVFCIK